MYKILKEIKKYETHYPFAIFNIARNIESEIYPKYSRICTVGDNAEHFFIIIKGSVAVLKAIENEVKISIADWVRYLRGLSLDGENYLYKKVIDINKDIIIFDKKRINIFTDFIFKRKLKELLFTFPEFDEIKQFFHLYRRKLTDFNLEKLEETYKLNDSQKVQNFFTKFLNSDLMKIDQRNSSIFNNNAEDVLNLLIIEYKQILCIKEGDYFGDYALDTNSTRTATIISNENETLIAKVRKEIYNEYIFQEKKKFSGKYVTFIFNCFFDKFIKKEDFDVKIYHYFMIEEYKKEEILFKEGDKINFLYFIFDGSVELKTSRNFYEMQNLIQEIIHLNEDVKEKIKSDKELHKFLKEKNLRNRHMKVYDLDYYTTKDFVIKNVTNNEILGIENYSFQKNAFYTATVKANTKVFKLDLNIINKLYSTVPNVKPAIEEKSKTKIYNLVLRFIEIHRSNLHNLFKEKNGEPKKLFKSIAHLNMKKGKDVELEKQHFNNMQIHQKRGDQIYAMTGKDILKKKEYDRQVLSEKKKQNEKEIDIKEDNIYEDCYQNYDYKCISSDDEFEFNKIKENKNDDNENEEYRIKENFLSKKLSTEDNNNYNNENEDDEEEDDEEDYDESFHKKMKLSPVKSSKLIDNKDIKSISDNTIYVKPKNEHLDSKNSLVFIGKRSFKQTEDYFNEENIDLENHMFKNSDTKNTLSSRSGNLEKIKKRKKLRKVSLTKISNICNELKINESERIPFKNFNKSQNNFRHFNKNEKNKSSKGIKINKKSLYITNLGTETLNTNSPNEKERDILLDKKLTEINFFSNKNKRSSLKEEEIPNLNTFSPRLTKMNNKLDSDYVDENLYHKNCMADNNLNTIEDIKIFKAYHNKQNKENMSNFYKDLNQIKYKMRCHTVKNFCTDKDNKFFINNDDKDPYNIKIIDNEYIKTPPKNLSYKNLNFVGRKVISEKYNLEKRINNRKPFSANKDYKGLALGLNKEIADELLVYDKDVFKRSSCNFTKFCNKNFNSKYFFKNENIRKMLDNKKVSAEKNKLTVFKFLKKENNIATKNNNESGLATNSKETTFSNNYFKSVLNKNGRNFSKESTVSDNYFRSVLNKKEKKFSKN